MTDSSISEAQLPAPEATVRDLGRILRRRGWIIVTAVLLATATAAVVSQVTAPVYVATAVLSADKNPPVILLSSSAQAPAPAPPATAGGSDAATLAELVKQDSVRDAAMARLRGIVEPAVVKRLWLRMRVQRVRDTDIVQVSAEDTNPKVAALVANAVITSVIDQDLSARRRWATNARQFIGHELAMVGGRLQLSEDALTAFENEHHSVALSDQTSLSLRKLATLEDQLFGLNLEQRELQGGLLVQEVSAGPAGSQASGPQPPLIANLQNQLAALKVELSGLRKQFTPKHPTVLSTEAKIEEVRRRLDAEVTRSLTALGARGRSLAAAIGELEQQLRGVPTLEAKLARITRDKTEAERTYGLLSQRFQEAQIAEASIGSPIRVVDAARTPDRPARPRRTLNTVVGAVLGLILGVGAVFVEEHLDDTVRSADDVERVLGVPVVGTLPLAVRRSRAPRQGSWHDLSAVLLRPGSPPSVTEPYRALRTQLLHALRGAQMKSLLITSCLPGEGKSAVAVNLALMIAQVGRKVWLVDCDLRQRTLEHAFPEAQSPGLASYLSGQSGPVQVVRPTAVSGLSFVAAGTHASAPGDLLQSSRMATLLQMGQASADVVLLDSPAFLPMADAEILASQVDGTLLVVRADGTHRAALAETRKRLERMGVSAVAAVLVHVPSSRPRTSTMGGIMGRIIKRRAKPPERAA